MKRTPTRSGRPLFLTLPPDDVTRAKSQAARLGMTVSNYVSRLLAAPAQPTALPASDWQVPALVGNCIVDALAIAKANGYGEISGLLMRAREMLFDEMTKHVASYDRAVTDLETDTEWRTTGSGSGRLPR
jgi:hypothetical protein